MFLLCYELSACKTLINQGAYTQEQKFTGSFHLYGIACYADHTEAMPEVRGQWLGDERTICTKVSRVRRILSMAGITLRQL